MREFNAARRVSNRYRKAENKSFSQAEVPELIQLELRHFIETLDIRMPSNCSWELYFDGAVHLDHRQSIQGCKANNGPEHQRWHWTNLWPLLASENSGKGGAQGGDTNRVWNNEKNRWNETSEEDEDLIKQCINKVGHDSKLINCTV